MKTIDNLEEISRIIESETMVLAYFTTAGCNVCKDLFPKIEKMMQRFPEVVGIKGDADQTTELVGAYGVFVVPTIILFVEGKETIRRARTIGVEELAGAIERYYGMVF